MPKNKSVNLRSFLFVKTGVHHGCTFHPYLLMTCNPFMSIFGCDFHPIRSFIPFYFPTILFTRFYFDHIPLFRSRASMSFVFLCFSTYLFLFHLSTSALICFICTPLFHSHSSCVYTLYHSIFLQSRF